MSPPVPKPPDPGDVFAPGGEIGAALENLPPDPEPEAPPDPVGAWDHFWRAVGRDVPANVNRSIRLRQQLRQLGRL